MFPAALRECLYENVVVGEELGPIELVVDDYFVKRYAFTVDDYLPWAFSDIESPFKRRVGQATILGDDLLKVIYSHYDKNTLVGLHTDEQLSFSGPVFVGERVTLKGRYVDKYIGRRDDGHVVFESEATGEDGRVLLRHHQTEIMRLSEGHGAGGGRAEPPAKRITGEFREDVAPAEFASRELKPGTPLVPLVKHITQEQISVFSERGSFRKGLHNDPEIARRAGLPSPIAQGMMEVCYASEMLTHFFGATFFTTGKLHFKFLNPVFPGDTLTVHGAVANTSGDRLELEVWVKNPKKNLTAVGWASAQLG